VIRNAGKRSTANGLYDISPEDFNPRETVNLTKRIVMPIFAVARFMRNRKKLLVAGQYVKRNSTTPTINPATWLATLQGGARVESLRRFNRLIATKCAFKPGAVASISLTARPALTRMRSMYGHIGKR
jgi:hypothetical protein